MEAQTGQPPSGSGPFSAAYPRWVMLEKDSNIIYGGNSVYEAKTLAAARTSAGHLIQFSLQLEEPLLAISRVRVQAPDGADVDDYEFMVVAAHGDSLLIRVVQEDMTDYFVYNAGDAAAEPPRPPMLSLLPPFHTFYPTEVDEEEELMPRHLNVDATGFLRRGEDELVVADFTMVKANVAELCLFRSGEWSVMHLPISYGDAGGVWHTVGPVGDRQLCWQEIWYDVLVICDVFEESPRVQCLRLPKDPCPGMPSSLSQTVCSAASTLKFVNILPRCCCGGTGATNCKHSRHAYTIHTWTLRMDDDGIAMEWVKDGMVVDASELWALDAYKGLPRVPLDHPVVSMDENEPHVIYFQLCESRYVKRGGDDIVWLLKVDTRSKAIQSVQCREVMHTLIPTNVLHFFNSYTASDGALTGQRQMGAEGQTVVIVDADEQLLREDNACNPTLQPSSSFAEPSEGASEFWEVFLEISRYGLGGDELKAYRILSHDNGRRFRSLLRLPKNMRKDWLLMEINKAGQD